MTAVLAVEFQTNEALREKAPLRTSAGRSSIARSGKPSARGPLRLSCTITPEYRPMLCSLSAACTVFALLTAGGPAGALPHLSRVAPSDSATIMILEELRAAYRDIDDKNWTDLITHFLPAKVTARFSPPTSSIAWSSLESPTPIPSSGPERAATEASYDCAPHAAIAVVGSWARVLARRCDGPVFEAWFYFLSGHWKIVHLVGAEPPAIWQSRRDRDNR